MQSRADQGEGLWQHSAVESEVDWADRMGQLRWYHHRHGDTFAGMREADNPELGRWAAAQRAALAEGTLAPRR